MATLTKDSFRIFDSEPEPLFNHVPMIASDIIYAGAAVGESSSTGTARPLVAGDVFLGFSEEKADNSSGAASAITVAVRQRGTVKLSVVGVASAADLGANVYASDDNVFTLTAGSNTLIGKVVRWETGTTALVFFTAATISNTTSGAVTVLTDSTGGTANDTVADVSTVVTGVDGTGSNAASKADVDARLSTINDNFADLAAKVNELIANY